MFSDYGKLAYVKVMELEKRLELLKKDVKSSLTEVLCFDLTTPENRTVFNKKFSCKCNATSMVSVAVEVQTDTELSISYKLVCGDIVVKSGVLQGGAGNFTVEHGVSEGEVKYTLTLSCITSFYIKNVYVTLSGKISHLTEFKRMSSYTHGDVTFVSTVSGNLLILYGYSSAEGFYELFFIPDVKDTSIVGFIGEELYVAYIDTSNKLRVLIYNPVTYNGLFANLGVSGATSVCGYNYGEGIEILFVLTGTVYSGVYVKGEKFNYSAVKRKGVKVTAEADYPGAYIISDAYASNKLVTDTSTYVLAKGINHHFTKTDNGYEIVYNDANILYCQMVGEGVKTPQNAGYSDERITLVDGKFLLRVRDLLKISED